MGSYAIGAAGLVGAGIGTWLLIDYTHKQRLASDAYDECVNRSDGYRCVDPIGDDNDDWYDAAQARDASVPSQAPIWIAFGASTALAATAVIISLQRGNAEKNNARLELRVGSRNVDLRGTF